MLSFHSVSECCALESAVPIKKDVNSKHPSMNGIKHPSECSTVSLADNCITTTAIQEDLYKDPNTSTAGNELYKKKEIISYATSKSTCQSTATTQSQMSLEKRVNSDNSVDLNNATAVETPRQSVSVTSNRSSSSASERSTSQIREDGHNSQSEASGSGSTCSNESSDSESSASESLVQQHNSQPGDQESSCSSSEKNGSEESSKTASNASLPVLESCSRVPTSDVATEMRVSESAVVREVPYHLLTSTCCEPTAHRIIAHDVYIAEENKAVMESAAGRTISGQITNASNSRVDSQPLSHGPSFNRVVAHSSERISADGYLEKAMVVEKRTSEIVNTFPRIDHEATRNFLRIYSTTSNTTGDSHRSPVEMTTTGMQQAAPMDSSTTWATTEVQQAIQVHQPTSEVTTESEQPGRIYSFMQQPMQVYSSPSTTTTISQQPLQPIHVYSSTSDAAGLQPAELQPVAQSYISNCEITTEAQQPVLKYSSSGQQPTSMYSFMHSPECNLRSRSEITRSVQPTQVYWPKAASPKEAYMSFLANDASPRTSVRGCINKFYQKHETAKLATPSITHGNSTIKSPSITHGNSTVKSPSITHGNATITSPSITHGNATITSPSITHGNATITSPSITHGNATITSPSITQSFKGTSLRSSRGSTTVKRVDCFEKHVRSKQLCANVSNVGSMTTDTCKDSQRYSVRSAHPKKSACCC